MSETGNATLYEALAAAQAEMENAKFNRENKHFNSKYADMASVHDAVAPVLGKHGIAYFQTDHVIDSGPICRTTLRKGDESIVSDTPIIVGDQTTPQAFFSARTYARRHGLAGIVGIASEDDDDGANAEKKGDVSRPGAPKNSRDPKWQGPLPKGKLQDAMGLYSDALDMCQTIEDHEALGGKMAVSSDDMPKNCPEEWKGGMTFDDVFAQCEHDQPGWITGHGMPELFIPFNSRIDAALDRLGANGGDE